MAGYFLYSLDWSRVSAFLNEPDDVDIRKLAECVSDGLDEIDSSIDDDDPLASWPSSPSEMLPKLTEHLAKPDWYADFSDSGRAMWERAFEGLCHDCMGFECESDGVYWNIHSETLSHHRLKNDTIGKMEITHFGHRPFRFLYQGKLSWEGWYPYHSMHTPTECQKLIEQFSNAKERLMSCRYEEVPDDYEELMPVLEKMVRDSRVLYVSVDT